MTFTLTGPERTAKVRGLLCTRCNAAIGLLGDDMDMLASAITYLDGHR